MEAPILVAPTAVRTGRQHAIAVLQALLVTSVVSIVRRSERPTTEQLGGIGLLMLGAALYFGPFQLAPGVAIGLFAAGVCVAAATASSHLGRRLARDAIGLLGGSIGLTAASMAVGAVALLVAGLVLEGWPRPDLAGWLIIGWLAIVNTAFAFTLWNHTLRTLTAVESSVVNNTMTVQVAVLAIVFLGERLGPLQLLGLLLAAAGAAAVQLAPVLRRNR